MQVTSSTKGEPVLCANTKKLLFLSLSSLKKKSLRLHKLPPASAAVKCQMHGRMWVAGRVYAAVTG